MKVFVSFEDRNRKNMKGDSMRKIRHLIYTGQLAGSLGPAYNGDPDSQARREAKSERRRRRKLRKLARRKDWPQKPPQIPNLTKIEKYAMEMRKRPTKAERGVMNALLVLDVRFLHQHIIGNRILDFYLPDHSVGIEADGGQHFTPEGISNDRKREAEILSIQPSLRFIRLGNKFILGNKRLADELTRRIFYPSLG